MDTLKKWWYSLSFLGADEWQRLHLRGKQRKAGAEVKKLVKEKEPKSGPPPIPQADIRWFGPCADCDGRTGHEIDHPKFGGIKPQPSVRVDCTYATTPVAPPGVSDGRSGKPCPYKLQQTEVKDAANKPVFIFPAARRKATTT